MSLQTTNLAQQESQLSLTACASASVSSFVDKFAYMYRINKLHVSAR